MAFLFESGSDSGVGSLGEIHIVFDGLGSQHGRELHQCAAHPALRQEVTFQDGRSVRQPMLVVIHPIDAGTRSYGTGIQTARIALIRRTHDEAGETEDGGPGD
jgi:hypothetical protein